MQASKALRLIIADGKPFDPLVEETQAYEIFYDEKKMVVDL